jgi:hypothetical protein
MLRFGIERARTRHLQFLLYRRSRGCNGNAARHYRREPQNRITVKEHSDVVHVMAMRVTARTKCRGVDAILAGRPIWSAGTTRRQPQLNPISPAWVLVAPLPGRCRP